VSITYENAQVYDPDIVLVDRFLKGDQHAFETLYRNYYGRIFSLARGVLLDNEEAADVTQEVFTLVYKALPKFNRSAKFSTWIFRIAVNRSIQESRKRRLKATHVELTELASQTTEEPEISIPDPHVKQCLERIPPQDRVILTLFYWQDMSLSEIASHLQINVNAVKTRLYRARERFRSYYEESTI
jgi:RNA polymerase sigma-70 factor, ECF subfamily